MQWGDVSETSDDLGSIEDERASDEFIPADDDGVWYETFETSIDDAGGEQWVLGNEASIEERSDVDGVQVSESDSGQNDFEPGDIVVKIDEFEHVADGDLFLAFASNSSMDTAVGQQTITGGEAEDDAAGGVINNLPRAFNERIIVAAGDRAAPPETNYVPGFDAGPDASIPTGNEGEFDATSSSTEVGSDENGPEPDHRSSQMIDESFVLDPIVIAALDID